MKKRFLTVAALCGILCNAKGQEIRDSSFQKKLLSKTSIELVYAHYLQDGNNSAVTGGRGTEKLTVYAPSVRISHAFKDYNTFHFNGGADAITSASTDKIDFVVSSASKKDVRSYANLTYERKLRKQDLTIGAGSGFSLESDYFSVPFLLSVQYTEPSRLRTYSAGLQVNFDDLRWGRINPDHWKPVKLIYPSELRDTAWFDHYRRQSYNLKLGFTQVLNRRTMFGVFPEPTYQTGLLATPFHRVYFKDTKVRVENLPTERLKLPVGLRLHYFLGKSTILKFNYAYYWDSFGIRSHSAEVESVFKASSNWIFTPFFRLYTQSASRYFRAYRQHVFSEMYYTSDFDLASFESLKGGINLRFMPSKVIFKRVFFNEVNMRYSYYVRSNGLSSHILSLSVGFERERYSSASGGSE
jgi:hypothetical protein